MPGMIRDGQPWCGHSLRGIAMVVTIWPRVKIRVQKRYIKPAKMGTPYFQYRQLRFGGRIIWNHRHIIYIHTCIYKYCIYIHKSIY